MNVFIQPKVTVKEEIRKSRYWIKYGILSGKHHARTSWMRLPRRQE